VRLAAVRALRSEGIRTGVNVMPVMPGINDCDNDLRALLTAARDAGASYASGHTVFLQGPTRGWFIARLRRDYPRIAARYELWTRTSSGMPREVQADVARRFRRLAREVGIPTRDEARSPRSAEAQRTFGFAEPSA
jgi:DNA repair photolyase